jgi:glutathione S-transferase
MLRQAEPALTLAGFACAAAGERLSAADLACLVERLDLVAAAEDRPLRDYFAAARARPGGENCAARPEPQPAARAKKLSRGAARR